MLAQLDRIVGRISTTMAFLGATILGLLAVLIVADIIGREIGRPIRGVVEIAAMVVVSATFLTIPFAMRRRGHVRSTILVSRVPLPVKRVLETFAYGMGAVIFAILAYSSCEAFANALAFGSYEGEGALRVPTYPARGLIFLGSAVMAAECLLAAIGAARGDLDD